MEEVQKLQAILSKPIRAIIIPHINPDGDALGSCLGWMHYLNKNGHQAKVIAPNAFPEFYNWMPGAGNITLYTKDPESVAKEMEEIDVIFCLDYNDLKRIGDFKDVVEGHSAKKVMIDHHQQPTDFAEVMFSNPKKSSTSEMVYDLICDLGHQDVIDKAIGDCLYTGIVTDTGSFRFGSTSHETHLAAAHLLSVGVKPDEVYTYVYDNNTLDRMHLMGYILVEKLHRVDGLQASYISISEVEQQRFNFQKGDSEGFVNFGLSVKGMKCTGFFRENEGYIKVSLRSKGDLDVNQIARKYFNGGGHQNAAGGKLEMSLDDAVKHFKSVMEKYSRELKID
jgi:phosphoesterase RecJ-like protein